MSKHLNTNLHKKLLYLQIRLKSKSSLSGSEENLQRTPFGSLESYRSILRVFNTLNQGCPGRRSRTRFQQTAENFKTYYAVKTSSFHAITIQISSVVKPYGLTHSNLQTDGFHFNCFAIQHMYSGSQNWRWRFLVVFNPKSSTKFDETLLINTQSSHRPSLKTMLSASSRPVRKQSKFSQRRQMQNFEF